MEIREVHRQIYLRQKNFKLMVWQKYMKRTGGKVLMFENPWQKERFTNFIYFCDIICYFQVVIL